MTPDYQTTSQAVAKNSTRVQLIEMTLEHYLCDYCNALNKQPLAEYAYKLRTLLAEIKAAPDWKST